MDAGLDMNKDWDERGVLARQALTRTLVHLSLCIADLRQRLAYEIVERISGRRLCSPSGFSARFEEMNEWVYILDFWRWWL